MWFYEFDLQTVGHLPGLIANMCEWRAANEIGIEIIINFKRPRLGDICRLCLSKQAKRNENTIT